MTNKPDYPRADNCGHSPLARNVKRGDDQAACRQADPGGTSIGEQHAAGHQRQSDHEYELIGTPAGMIQQRPTAQETRGEVEPEANRIELWPACPAEMYAEIRVGDVSRKDERPLTAPLQAHRYTPR